MLFINSASSAPDASDWLANSHSPRILHIFENACNLINERKEVLSIVTPQIGDGPFNLVLEDDISFSEHVRLESSVSVYHTQLTLHNLTIHTADAKLWNPRPDWERLHAQKADIANQLTKLPITNDSLPLPKALVSNLSSFLATADISSSLTATQKLAGLGAGLTPSGDDFIMGAVYASWIIHPPEVARILAGEVTSAATPLTTSLSAAWLRSAGKGEAGILWHEFFDALVFADSPRIHETVRNILAVGETSGVDALAGFLAVFRSWIGEADATHE